MIKVLMSRLTRLRRGGRGRDEADGWKTLAGFFVIINLRRSHRKAPLDMKLRNRNWEWIIEFIENIWSVFRCSRVVVGWIFFSRSIDLLLRAFRDDRLSFRSKFYANSCRVIQFWVRPKPLKSCNDVKPFWVVNCENAAKRLPLEDTTVMSSLHRSWIHSQHVKAISVLPDTIYPIVTQCHVLTMSLDVEHRMWMSKTHENVEKKRLGKFPFSLYYSHTWIN